MPKIGTQPAADYELPIVAILAYDGVNVFELGTALEIFGLANADKARYRVAVCAQREGQILSAGAVNVIAPCGPSIVAQAGTRGGFPCVFAQNAHHRKNVQFLFVNKLPSSTGHDLESFSRGLRLYLEMAQEWNGDVNTTEPLLAVFEPTSAMSDTKHYEQAFTDALQHLIDVDQLPWIGTLPKDPDAEFWTMSFMGTQIFINVSHPNHLQRRSRNLCNTMVLVINPRERFDALAGANKKGNAIRERIRQNVDIYDHIPRSPLLGHYQSGDLEWPQYMLPVDNDLPPMSCPLRFR